MRMALCFVSGMNPTIILPWTKWRPLYSLFAKRSNRLANSWLRLIIQRRSVVFRMRIPSISTGKATLSQPSYARLARCRSAATLSALLPAGMWNPNRGETMGVNRELLHLFVLPEDDDDRQLAVEFQAQLDIDRQGQMRVLGEAS